MNIVIKISRKLICKNDSIENIFLFKYDKYNLDTNG